MDEEEIPVFERDKTLMETFLSQTSGTENFSDISFIQRNLPVSDHFGSSHYANNSYAVDSEETEMNEKQFHCDIVDVAYPRGNGTFLSFGSDHDERHSEPSQSFGSTGGFDVIGAHSLSETHFANTKIGASATISLTDDAPQLSYEGAVSEEAENQHSSRISESSDDDQASSLCPVLTQESPFATVSNSVAEDSSVSSCPILQQEASVLQAADMSSSNVDAVSEASTSVRKWNGKNPLQYFSVVVGQKKLNFKVCDRISSCDVSEDHVRTQSCAFSDFVFKGNKCFVCGRTFKTRTLLREHQMSHTGARPMACSYCERVFFHKGSLQIHERIHTGEKPFQCPICTKCFARQTNYNIHMKLHASGRRYFCSFCGKWFRTESEMLGHQQQCLARMQGVLVNPERPLRYQCSFCDKMFHHRRDKNIHERTHTGERPYSCGYCGKGFTQSQALTIHIRTHTGERPYTCTICAKDFRDSSALRKHEFIKHTASSACSNLDDDVMLPVSQVSTPK